MLLNCIFTPEKRSYLGSIRFRRDYFDDGSDDGESDNDDSSGSSESCISTWIWSCGWVSMDSDLDGVGSPPSSFGSYDGGVIEVSA